MKRLEIPKINSINFGGKLIGIALLTGVIIPAVIWFLFHVFLWQLCLTGGLILLCFAVLFVIEMNQDFGKMTYYERHLKETIPFDSETQYAVIKSSICTGEKVAGFKNKETGAFTEVMLIKNIADETTFKKIYGIETLKVEY